MDLILDIKILIASLNQDVWIKLVLYDDDFHKYAYTIAGRTRFIKLFAVIEVVKVGNARIKHKLFGKKHRIGGPAIIWLNGRREWYRNGKSHRDDGPATIWPDGAQDWFRNGRLHRDGSPACIFASGAREWWQNGKLHRDDGPAVIYADGMQEWYRYGKRV